jgi:hypothetical protein
MTWLLTSQTILLGGYGLLLTNQKDATHSTLSGIYFLQVTISVVGLATAYIILRGVRAAIEAQGEFHRDLDKVVEAFLETHKDPINNGLFPQHKRGTKGTTNWGSWTAKGMPIVFIVVWVFWLVSSLRLLRDFLRVGAGASSAALTTPAASSPSCSCPSLLASMPDRSAPTPTPPVLPPLPGSGAPRVAPSSTLPPADKRPF